MGWYQRANVINQAMARVGTNAGTGEGVVLVRDKEVEEGDERRDEWKRRR